MLPQPQTTDNIIEIQFGLEILIFLRAEAALTFLEAQGLELRIHLDHSEGSSSAQIAYT